MCFVKAANRKPLFEAPQDQAWFLVQCFHSTQLVPAAEYLSFNLQWCTHQGVIRELLVSSTLESKCASLGKYWWKTEKRARNTKAFHVWSRIGEPPLRLCTSSSADVSKCAREGFLQLLRRMLHLYLHETTSNLSIKMFCLPHLWVAAKLRVTLNWDALCPTVGCVCKWKFMTSVLKVVWGSAACKYF